MPRFYSLFARAIALVAIIAMPASAVWAQTAPNGVSILGAGFGGVMAAGEGEVFIGSAPIGWQTGDEPPGTVYRYQLGEDGQWAEVTGISAGDGQIGDDFGRSIFYDEANKWLVVGAPGVNAAYVFKRNSGGWQEVAKVNPESLPEGTEFGGSYARAGYRTGNVATIGNDRIAVTSFGPDALSNTVFVFRMDGDSWVQEAALMQDGDNAESGFGWSIAATENTVFVSANRDNDGSGAIHVFSLGDEGWAHAGAVVTSAPLDDRSSLGQSLAFDTASNTLYAGAPGFDGFGAVLAFARNGEGNWVESARHASPEIADLGRPASGFGAGVAVSDSRLLVGSRGAAFAMDASGMTEGGFSHIAPPNDRARAGFGIGLAIQGDFVVVGSPSADYEEGIASVFQFDEEAEGWRYEATLASDISFLSSIYGEQIDCEEGSAEMFACNNVDLMSFMSSGELTSHRGVKMTDIWGWEDPETGKEWVVLGRTDGTVFVDISNPNNPVYVGQLYRTEGSPGSAWRDVKVYKNHAFIVADGADQHGVQIFDMTQLRNVKPEDMPVTFEETAHYDGTASTHNIVINEETGFAYAVGNRAGGKNPCGGQLHIFDVSDPANPQFAGCYSAGQGGTHDAQCVVYRGADTDYAGREICLASNGSSFVIADVTDKDSTVTVANTSYPNQAYTHQGWLTEDHNYFFMNDELDEMNGSVDQTRTLIWDVTDLDDPQLVREFFLDSGASDHNLYIRDNLMYQSNYQAGLRILDVSDPLNPVEVGHFDTAPYAEDAAGFGGSWSNYPYFSSGVIAVSSRSEGLFILKKRPVDM